MKTKHNTIRKTLIAATVAMLATSSVNAGNRYIDQDINYNNYSNVDFAKVVSVNDVIERVEYSEPVKSCYNKHVPVKHQRGHYDRAHSRTPDVLGAIIGAAVGNKVGKRGSSKGRRVATVAGAVLGGSIGRDVRKRSHRHDHYESEYKTVRHCDTTYEMRYKNEVVGYDVKYRYRGKVYSTRMNQHPGERIKVQVNVTPVYS